MSRSWKQRRLSSWGNSTPATIDHGLHRPDAFGGLRRRVDRSGPARVGLGDRGTQLPVLLITVRTVTEAMVVNAVRDAAWTIIVDASGVERRKMTPEGLYGRKKMTALIDPSHRVVRRVP